MTVIRDEVLEKVKNDALKVYVVWEPILPRDRREALPQAVALLAQEPRARQYWDPGAVSGKGYVKVLDLPLKSPVWDTYLLYPPGVRWEEAPPAPAFWMHQISFMPFSAAAKRFGPLRLDGRRFREEVQGLMSKVQP